MRHKDVLSALLTGAVWGMTRAQTVPPTNIFAVIGSNTGNSIYKFDLSSPGTKITYTTGIPANVYGSTVSTDGSTMYFVSGSTSRGSYSLNLGSNTNSPTLIAGGTAGLQDGIGTSAQFRNP